MAIDTSIYAQYAPKPRSVTDYLAEMDDQEQRKQTLQQNRLALMMNQGKLDDDMRTRQEMGVVRNALTRLAPTATDEDRLTALRGTNTVTGVNQAAALAKEMAAARQQKLQADKSAFELAKGRFDTYRRTLGVLADTPNLTKPMALQAAQDLVSQGIIDQQMFDAGAASLSDDPAQLRLQLRQGLASQASPEQILTAFGPKPTVVDGRVVDLNPRSQTYGQTTVQRQPNMAQDLLIPGANGQMVPNRQLIDTRTRLAQAGATTVSYGAPVEVELPDGTKAYVQPGNRPDAPAKLLTMPGTNIPLKPGKQGELNEGQGKAVGFAARMMSADATINELAEKGRVVQTPGSAGTGVIGSVVNAFSPEDNQRLDQAKRNFINAVLRRESGAAIGADEFANADRQYFPQPGEGPEVVKQKAEARRMAIKAMRNEVPNFAQSRIDAIVNPGKEPLIDPATAAQSRKDYDAMIKSGKVRRWNPQTNQLEEF